MKKVFIDSSILIEFEKGTQTEILLALLEKGYELYINSVVVSEYIYKLLAILGGKSPMSISENKQIKQYLDKHDTQDFLLNFNYLPISQEAILISLDLMKKYNLLPNDAQIISTCKINQISMLASLDTDFTEVCKQENIELISHIAQVS